MEDRHKGLHQIKNQINAKYLINIFISEMSPKKAEKQAETHREVADGTEKCAICEARNGRVRVPVNGFVTVPGWINRVSKSNKVQSFQHNRV